MTTMGEIVGSTGIDRIACEPERPPVGAPWGSERYRVQGYYVGREDERGSTRLVKPLVRHLEYESAMDAARELGDGYGVVMQVMIADLSTL